MKDPAFLFYSQDFQTGTQFLSDEQVGKYIRLLIAQHQHGHLTEKQVIHICKTYDNDVMLKFQKDDSGKYFNPRMDEEILRRKNYSESRKLNRVGKKEKKQHSKKHMNNISKTYDKHMETENENETINRNESEIEKKLRDFFSFRNQIKKPVAELSKDAFKRKLLKLGNNHEPTMIEILEQSIANGWQGIFELKTNNNGKQPINNPYIEKLRTDGIIK